jgi:GT2 family glycosyltransferase
VSVVVPHLDDLEGLARCMAALEAQTLGRDRFEIVVGDNGSRAGIEAVRRVARGARVVSATEKGAGPARNAAVAAASGEVLAFTDSDCIPSPGWLAAGLEALERADIVGGAMDVAVRTAGRPTPSEAFELAFAFDNRRYVETLGFSVTANLMVRRADFERVGGFRTGVPEDLDWCRKARGLGLTITYAAGASVAHPARHSFDELAAKWRRLTNEAFADWCEGERSRAAWAIRGIGVLASAAAHTPRAVASTRLSGTAQRLGAIAVLWRIRALRARWIMAQAAGADHNRKAKQQATTVQPASQT